MRSFLRVLAPAVALFVVSLAIAACQTSLPARIPGGEAVDPLPSVADGPTPLEGDGLGDPPGGAVPQPHAAADPLPVVVDGPTPLEGPTVPPTDGPAGGARPPSPPIPAPPAWDPDRDRKRPVDPGTAGPGADPDAPPAGAAGDPLPTAPSTPPQEQPDPKPAQPAPPSPASPWLSEPPRPANPEPPPSAASAQPDVGAPPSGALPLPWAPETPSKPSAGASPPIPARAEPPAQPPSGGSDEPDPWVPGAGPGAPAPADPSPDTPSPDTPAPDTPVPDAPSPARPSGDPWVPGAGPGDPAPTVPVPDTPPTGAERPPRDPAEPPSPGQDPWVPGAGGETPPPAKPAAEPDPWLPAPGSGGAPETKPGGGSADPWQPEDSGPETFVGRTPEARAMEQVTRLMDSPGSRRVRGYPPEIVPSADPGMALTAGGRPAVIVFFDDGVRASDLQAAALLPLLVQYRDRIDFVAIDRRPGSTQASGAEALAKMYLDHVPTTVVLDPARKTRLYRSGLLKASEVESVLARVTAETQASPSPQTPRPNTPTPGLPRKDPAAPTDPDAPPAGRLPALPGQPPSAPANEPRSPGITFTPPADYSAKQHAERLRSAPGERGLPGYPGELVRSAPAERVLAAGHRPLVIIFFDDSSKASDLQAADFLPLLVRRAKDADIVLIDVGTRARWSDAQKKVVRTYYNFYVPTTVVLAPNRAPVRSWYNRISVEDLDRAIDEAVLR